MPFSIELLLVIFLSAFIQSAFGFGFILFSLSVGSLFFPVKEFLPFCLIMGIFIDFFLAATNYKHRPKKHFDYILMGVLGSPIGVFLYFLMDSNIFDPLLGILLIICVLLLFYDRFSIPGTKNIRYFYGLLTGVLAGAFGISGPFVTLVLLSDETLDRKSMIFLMNLFFFAVASISLPCFYLKGLYNGVEFTNFSLMCASAGFGYLSGAVFGKYFSSYQYNNVLLIMIFISAIFLIIP